LDGLGVMCDEDRLGGLDDDDALLALNELVSSAFIDVWRSQSSASGRSGCSLSPPDALSCQRNPYLLAV